MNQTVDIVLISGQQGSGKTTTSNALIKEAKRVGYEYTHQIRFADPLYVMHEYLLNKMEGYTGKGRAVKDGRLLQMLGTEWGRETFGPDVWMQIAKNEIQKKTADSVKKQLVVIDDCRFENEFDGFPEALRVRLSCSETERQARTNAWRDRTDHPSEVSLNKYSEAKKFDMYFNTSKENPIGSTEHIVTLIIAQLQKRNWIGKRHQDMM